MERLLSTPFPATSRTIPLLTTAAVAKWLGVSTRTVCLWAECKMIPALKIGRQWRFREGELSDWLRAPESGNVINRPRELSRAAGVSTA